MAPSGPSYTRGSLSDRRLRRGSLQTIQLRRAAHGGSDQAPPPLPTTCTPPPDDGTSGRPATGLGRLRLLLGAGVWVEPRCRRTWLPLWGFYSDATCGTRHWGMHIGWYGASTTASATWDSYEGGYWNGALFYNRVYNNTRARVHNVVRYRANVRVNDNSEAHERGNNNERGNMAVATTRRRPSYRGGPNGVQAQPRPSKGMRTASHRSAMSTQVQHEQNYSTHGGQYAARITTAGYHSGNTPRMLTPTSSAAAQRRRRGRSGGIARGRRSLRH